MFCYLDEFLWCIYQISFWLCECPKWNAFSKNQQFCVVVFFDKDCWNICISLNREKNKNLKDVFCVYIIF